MVADERTNSVLVTGDKNDRLRYRALITHLDTPLEEGGDTQVRYLRYTDAVDLATKLQSQYSGTGAAGGRRPRTRHRPPSAATSASGPTNPPTRSSSRRRRRS